ncbi:uncharacterized protein EAE98_003453 [Botrytis deweyae]|uniref:Zn(2)-C6 fungal-type domain-containing protein n=1 Tax=Botrytis deweyae TaxID=2478750 RepID=A0ABQ7ITM0_9HELO|nr:uncharacterized protein EAE98_003453 [Botrytis deweyae]KAF7933744.1 hypothetical protein EAE98_003453 [Botrytis deweyae]
MMDNGQPDPKRPRLGPGPAWPIEQPNQPNPSRALPPLQPPYNSGPFSRPDSHAHPLDRRPPHPNFQEHQDPHRPNSGHAHVYHNIHNQHPPPPPIPSYNGHNGHNGPREPIVKPDPSEEPPQHRPPPTTNGADHHVNLPYAEERGRPFPPRFDQPPPPQHTPQHTPQMYNNNPAPPMYQPQPPPPSTSPMTTPTFDGAMSMYGPPQGHPHPPPREQYSVTPYSQPAKPRKAQRAAQACDSCRNLKAKCDEGRPACGSCKEKNFECHYRDPPPKPIDKASTDIIEALIRLEHRNAELFNVLQTGLESLNKRVDELQERVGAGRPLSSIEGHMKEEGRDDVQLPDGEFGTFHGSNSNILHDATPIDPPVVGPVQPLEGSTPGALEEEEEGDPVPPGQPLIPVNHTTGAARLLLVPSVKQMINGGGGLPKNVKDEKYPMLQEERRGLLRLFGRGEGIDLAQGYDRDPMTDHADSVVDTSSDVSSPAGEEWGQLGGMTPPSSAPDYPPPVVGSIMSDGMPDFRKSVVLELVKSYKEHMNIMHPILIPRRLDALVESFLKSIPSDSAKPKQVQNLASQHTSHAGFVNMKPPESPGSKRKRSPGVGEPPEISVAGGYGTFVKPGHPSRSISTALVLVVLALGKICQERQKIPELPSDKDVENPWGHINSPVVRNGHPSPIQSSPTQSSELPSPQENIDRFYPRSRRTSIEGDSYLARSGFRPRNVDVIPGLAYFALATDIIGNQLGGNSLQHVHVNILAGLYHGQLARVLESHSYIHQACRALQVILRPKLDRFKKLKQDGLPVLAKDNPLIFAFWTCLQLESDIVAELPCPHSGILTFEENMPSPNIVEAVKEGFDQMVLLSYQGQLYLRKHLNQLHNMFYKPDNDSQFPSVYTRHDPNHFESIATAEEFLYRWKEAGGTSTWQENDPPASDILTARMRAKYYGAQVITYRNFVLKILEHSHAVSTSNSVERASDDFRNGIEVPSINKHATSAEEIDEKALAYAKNGIQALVNSTRAFHGLGEGRLFVTNPWGTAHAQWGNVLTLQAAWNDHILRPLFDGILDKQGLSDLLKRTLSFLGIVATRSSALYTDMKILVNAGKYTGLLEKDYQLPKSLRKKPLKLKQEKSNFSDASS